MNTGKGLSRFALDKDLPKLKAENPWLSEVPSQVLQQSLVDLDKAFTNFFRKTTKFPNFKKKRTDASCRFPQGIKVDFETNIISLPKLGKVKIKLSRKFVGTIKSCTVSRGSTGKFYVSILVDDGVGEIPKLPIHQDRAIGVDVGLIDFITTSKGEKVKAPKFYRGLETKLKEAQRFESRKKKGSNNRKKARQRVNLIHEKIKNLRSDFLHKTSTRLVNENQVICIEDLNVKGMMKNRKLSKSIGDVGWSEFFRMLEYKSEKVGKTVLKINRFQPSSKICSCGEVNKILTLSDRKWTCSNCNLTHDRDVLAAQNILKFAFLENLTRRDTA